MTAQFNALEVQQAAQLIRQAHRVVALTGAGISTPSGIPDFRSASSGLWARYDPFQVASLSAFRYDPAKFYEWFYELACQIRLARPNPAHRALARLEQATRLAGLVTQNVDGLHQEAGSHVVHELHGSLRRATCIGCYQNLPARQFFDQYVESRQPPRCPDCGDFLKPDAVLFGEQLPHDAVKRADRLFRGADLVLVIGSSLEVTPAAQMPLVALHGGAELVIINREPTYLDGRASVLLQEDLAVTLPRVADEVLID